MTASPHHPPGVKDPVPGSSIASASLLLGRPDGVVRVEGASGELMGAAAGRPFDEDRVVFALPAIAVRLEFDQGVVRRPGGCSSFEPVEHPQIAAVGVLDPMRFLASSYWPPAIGSCAASASIEPSRETADSRSRAHFASRGSYRSAPQSVRGKGRACAALRPRPTRHQERMTGRTRDRASAPAAATSRPG
jgi:hypothetical protein